jgi:hypothetical protein
MMCYNLMKFGYNMICYNPLRFIILENVLQSHRIVTHHVGTKFKKKSVGMSSISIYRNIHSINILLRRRIHIPLKKNNYHYKNIGITTAKHYFLTFMLHFVSHMVLRLWLTVKMIHLSRFHPKINKSRGQRS